MAKKPQWTRDSKGFAPAQENAISAEKRAFAAAVGAALAECWAREHQLSLAVNDATKEISTGIPQGGIGS